MPINYWFAILALVICVGLVFGAAKGGTRKVQKAQNRADPVIVARWELLLAESQPALFKRAKKKNIHFGASIIFYLASIVLMFASFYVASRYDDLGLFQFSCVAFGLLALVNIVTYRQYFTVRRQLLQHVPAEHPGIPDKFVADKQLIVAKTSNNMSYYFLSMFFLMVAALLLTI
ncbi:hypothetical protein [Lapidilactobacillus wuchangensis]|uniref:hypothetical protein n=1 Tax=Lapidilactobacillus wuchangensis TaxID=2486001 RepID=UPI000F7979A8|nr:hypothetical protein [Lapidilactobacillus wuchangensis]